MKTFDYKGYTEAELLSLVNNCKTVWPTSSWWTAENYSFGKYIRDYAFYPSFLPLRCVSDHSGPPLFDKIRQPRQELKKDEPVCFLHSKQAADFFSSTLPMPCHCMYSPMVWCRKKHHINKSKKTKGTLVYLDHTLSFLEFATDLIEYIIKLKELPQKFQPVCISMHQVDVQKGTYKIFQDNDIPVYTAGASRDSRFAKRWYDLIKNFSYTSSTNLITSAVYSVEMGIPFFLYGPDILFSTHDDPLFDDYEKSFKKVHENPKLAFFESTLDLFRYNENEEIVITPKQKKYVDEKLGLDDAISRRKMHNLLFEAYFKKEKWYYIFPRIVVHYWRNWLSDSTRAKIKKLFRLKQNIRALKV